MKEIVKGIFVETEFEGVNVAAIKVDDNLICVDTPSYPRDARQWTTTLGRLHPRPARFLFLTDANGDRLLNARWLHAPLVVHQQAADLINELKRRYPAEWIQSLIKRNSTAGKELSSRPIEPVALSFSDEIKLLVDGISIVLRHESGPMPSSSWLYIPERKMLFTGDSVVVGTHPPIANMHSKQWIASLERLAELDGVIDVIVPGRGDLTDISAVPPIIDYLRHIRSIIIEHIEAGKTEDSLSEYVDDLLDRFPVGSLPINWVRSQIAKGLERVYQELLVEEYVDSAALEEA
jgi:cyclase